MSENGVWLELNSCIVGSHYISDDLQNQAGKLVKVEYFSRRRMDSARNLYAAVVGKFGAVEHVPLQCFVNPPKQEEIENIRVI